MSDQNPEKDYEAFAQGLIDKLKVTLENLKVRLLPLPIDTTTSHLNNKIKSSISDLQELDLQLQRIKDKSTAVKVVGLWTGTSEKMGLLFLAIKGYGLLISELGRGVMLKESDGRVEMREGETEDPAPPYSAEPEERRVVTEIAK